MEPEVVTFSPFDLQTYARECGPTAVSELMGITPESAAELLVEAAEILEPLALRERHSARVSGLAETFGTSIQVLLFVLGAFPGVVVVEYDPRGQPIASEPPPSTETDDSLPESAREEIRRRVGAHLAALRAEGAAAVRAGAPVAGVYQPLTVHQWLAGPGRTGRWLLHVSGHVLSATDGWLGWYTNAEILGAYSIQQEEHA